MAQIKIDKKTTCLGRYDKLEEAVEVRRAAEKMHYKEFIPSNRQCFLKDKK